MVENQPATTAELLMRKPIFRKPPPNWDTIDFWHENTIIRLRLVERLLASTTTDSEKEHLKLELAAAESWALDLAPERSEANWALHPLCEISMREELFEKAGDILFGHPWLRFYVARGVIYLDHIVLHGSRFACRRLYDFVQGDDESLWWDQTPSGTIDRDILPLHMIRKSIRDVFAALTKRGVKEHALLDYVHSGFWQEERLRLWQAELHYRSWTGERMLFPNRVQDRCCCHSCFNYRNWLEVQNG